MLLNNTLGFIKSSFTYTPIVSLLLIQGFEPPKDIATQTWILTAVGTAMGIVRILLWLRGERTNKSEHSREDYSSKKEYRDLQNELLEHKVVLDKLAYNEERLSETQSKLADNQIKAIENHAKILETIAILRLVIENQEQNTRGFIDQVSSRSINELKEFMRNK